MVARDRGLPFRFRVPLLIAAAIAISYIDRQTLPVALREIQRSISLSNTQFAQLQTAFLLPYAFAGAAAGWLVDILGVRFGFLLMMGIWSLACAGQSLATGFWTLCAARSVLGLGEGGGFPAAAKTVAEHFSARDRSMAMGIIHAGSSIGAIIAPPLIGAAVLLLDWHWAFLLLGLLGLLWSLGWVRLYRPPQADGVSRIGDARPGTLAAWRQVLEHRSVWGLLACRFLFYDSAFYFCLFWLPKYLYDARGFDTRSVAYYAWIPFAAHALGGFTGGWVSSRIVRSGRSVDFARKAVMGMSALLTPAIFLVTRSSVEFAIILLSIAYYGQAASSAIVMVLPADLFPSRQVGSAAGLIAFGGAFGGMAFGAVVAALLNLGFGYQSVFSLVALFHPIAYCIILMTVRIEGRGGGSIAG